MQTCTIEQLSIGDAQVRGDNIYGVAVTTEGEAKGHGVWLNAAFVDEVIRLGNEQTQGVKVHYGHSPMCTDALGTELGRARNFRRENNRAVADITFTRTPENAGQIDHILTFAKQDPTMFGQSIVFKQGESVDENGEPFRKANGKLADGKEYATIQELHATDFTSDPAATNGIFSQRKTEVAERSILNALGLPKVKQFMSDFKQEIIESMAKEEKLSSHFTKMFAAMELAGKQSTEMALKDGRALILFSQSAIVGDPVVIKGADGGRCDAPTGQYETPAGDKVTVTDSIITEFTQAPETTIQQSAQAAEIARLQAELQLKDRLLLSKDQPEPHRPPANDLRGDDRLTRNSKGKFTEEYKTEVFQALFEHRVFDQNTSHTGKSPFRKSRNHTNFSDGFDFSESIARNFDIYSEVMTEQIAKDSILQYFRRINGQTWRAGTPQYDTVIPYENFILDYGERFYQVKNEECDPQPRNGFKTTDRVVTVVPFGFDIEFCPVKARLIYDGLMYEGDRIPAEVLTMSILTNQAIQATDQLYMYGQGAENAQSRNFIGLLAQIQLAVAAGQIPAAQVISQASWTNTTALGLVNDLVKAIPDNMIARGYDISMYLTRQMRQFYADNYNAAFSNTARLTKEQAFMVQNYYDADVMLKPLFTLGRNAFTQLNTAIVTNSANIWYLLEIPNEAGAITVERIPGTRGKILVSGQNYGGINIAFPSEIVTNIEATLPTVFTPNTL